MPAFSLGAASDLGPAPPRLAQPPWLIPWHHRLDGGVLGGGCGHQVALLAQDRRPRCLPPARTKEGRDPPDHLCHLTLGGWPQSWQSWKAAQRSCSFLPLPERRVTLSQEAPDPFNSATFQAAPHSRSVSPPARGAARRGDRRGGGASPSLWAVE